MKLSDYIQSVLDDKGLTMTKAAQGSGVSASSISRLKSGASDLTPSLAAKLSAVGFDYEKMFELDMKEKIEKTKKLIKKH